MQNQHRPSQLARVIAVFIFGLMVASGPISVRAADTDRQMEKKEGDVEASRHDMIGGSHVEGHIAFLHAELGITPEQERLWAPVVAAMRQDVETLEKAHAKVARQGRLNLLQYLENRATFAQLRAEGEERFLRALTPLYNNLSSRQKEMADELLIPSSPADSF